MFQEFGASSLKRTMANSTDFHVTFFGVSACAAPRHGRRMQASPTPNMRDFADHRIFTLRNPTRAPARPTHTRGSQPSPRLFSFLSSSERVRAVYDRCVRAENGASDPKAVRIQEPVVSRWLHRTLLRMVCGRYTCWSGTTRKMRSRRKRAFPEADACCLISA